jgi:hypothetical protein
LRVTGTGSEMSNTVHRVRGTLRKLLGFRVFNREERQFVDPFRATGRKLDMLAANAAVELPTAKEPSWNFGNMHTLF